MTCPAVGLRVLVGLVLEGAALTDVWQESRPIIQHVWNLVRFSQASAQAGTDLYSRNVSEVLLASGCRLASCKVREEDLESI